MLARVVFGATLATAVVGYLVSAQPPVPTKGRKVALVIGVNEYDNVNLDNLKYAERDATELGDVLQAAGFAVTVLTGGPKDGTGKDAYFAALAKTLKGVKRDDMVLLAFSGHGVQLFVKDGEAQREVPYFCPADGVPTDPATLISLNDVLKHLGERGGSHNLLLVDACRNVVDPNRGARDARGIDGSQIANLRAGTAVFFSCSSRQKAYESAKAGGGHGVFFHFVLQGLRGKAANAKGHVTWDGLVGYVKDQLADAADTLLADVPKDNRQEPFVMGNLGTVPPLATATVARRAVRLVPPFSPEDAARGRAEFAEATTLPPKLTTKSGVELVLIPPGEFQMGADEPAADVVKEFPDEEEKTFANESPARRAEVGGFYMGVTEVTVGQFEQFVAAEKYRTDQERGVARPNPTGAASGLDDLAWNDPKLKKDRGKTHPVTHVTYSDAVAFCKWLSRQEGRTYRLPTQREWEYAARAGTTTRYWSGNDPESLARVANVPDRSHTRTLKAPPFVGVVRYVGWEDAKTGGPVWRQVSTREGHKLTFEIKKSDEGSWFEAVRGDPDAGLPAGVVRVTNAAGVPLRVAGSKGETVVPARDFRDIAYIPIRKSLAIESDDGYAGLAPVGMYPGNPFGLKDVHGNVWEWCQDTMKDEKDQEVFVLRGGCFL